MTPDEEKLIRARQKSRALVTGLILAALVILFYAITMAKIGASSAICWRRSRLLRSTATGATAGR